MRKELIYVHIAVMLFGCAGIFAKLIASNALVIVFGRVLFASLSLFFVLKLRNESFLPQKKRDYFKLLFIGIVLAVHWGSFFYSIKLSNVAIGLLTFSTFPVFTAFFEPFYFKTRFDLKNLFYAIVAFGGVILIVPGIDFTNTYFLGALWGIVSGLTFAILSVINKSMTKDYSSNFIAFWQDSVATVLLLPFVFYKLEEISSVDWALLVLLGVVFTALSHSLFIAGIKKITASKASVIACLEPVYGMILAMLLIGERYNLRTFLGAFVIISLTIYISLERAPLKKRSPE